jgi:DtxR family transcriptional regulator, Mn-dependent transcriptional regulator
MIAQPLSQSTEMYLKTMAELSESETVAIGRLAERLGVTPVSANEMVRRLTEQGLVKHTPYKGATLTKKGRKAACNVVRRQMLWECFLYDHLKIEWSQVYELACELEHATAPEVTEALAAFLGQPDHCPYGDLIPSPNGESEPYKGKPLSTATVGETVRIWAVRATATDVLKHLQERGLLPGREVMILEAAPMQGPLTLRVDPAEKSGTGGKEIALGLLLAEFVIVETHPIE